MLNRVKNISLYILFSLVFPQMLSAQQTGGVFIMSSVGVLQNMSNNSLAVIFNTTATCLNIQNGSAVIIGDRGTGAFVINCDVATKFNSLGIQLYPNPVGVNTKVKFINTPPLNDQFSIAIWNAQGFKISSIKATGYEILHGKQMDFSGLEAGTFIIQVESEKYKDALKFIKAK